MNNLMKRLVSFGVFSVIGLLLTISVSAQSMKIVIDPGHGGSDPGAVNYGVLEKTINLELSNLVKSYLNPYADVVLTRDTDKYLTLEDRANFANSLNADLFISIHHDSNFNSAVNGISTHYSSYRANLNSDGYYVIYNGRVYDYLYERKETNGTYIYYMDNGSVRKVHVNYCTVYDSTPSTVATESKELSLEIAKELASLGFNKMYTTTGNKDHNLYVTRHTNMTSVLIEGGFTSNFGDLNKIKDPIIKSKMAKKIADTIIEFYDLKGPEIALFTADKQSPQDEGTRVIVNAKASGKEEVEYKFWEQNLTTGQWKLLQDYSSDTNIGWVPKESGKYKLVVHVKEKSSQKAYDTYKTMEYTVNKVIKVDSLVTDKQSPQDQGAKVIVNAKASGKEKVEYKFWLQDLATGKWNVLQDYSGTANAEWVPKESGKYKLVVHVREVGSEKSYESYKAIEYEIKDKVKVTELSIDKASPQDLGAKMNINAQTNTASNLEYKFWEQNIETGKWTILQDYSKSQGITWVPKESGKYKLVVHVREVGIEKSYEAYKAVDYEINDTVGVQVTEFSVDKVSPQVIGTNHVLSAVADGSTNLEYKFWEQNIETGKWTVLQDYSKNQSLTWTPKVSGRYKLVVHVREVGVNKSYESFKVMEYNIIEKEVKIGSFIVDKPSPQANGSKVLLSVQASGADSIHYKFWLQNLSTGKWTMLQGYSNDMNYEWTPTVPGEYKLVVHVKDALSAKAYDAYLPMQYIVK